MARRRRRQKKAPRGSLRARILGALARRDATAADLSSRIGAGRAVTYQALARLEREGKIKTRGTVKAKRGRARVYTLAGGLMPGSKPRRVALGVSGPEELSTRVLLRALGEAVGGEATLVHGRGGRAGKGLYLQITVE